MEREPRVGRCSLHQKMRVITTVQTVVMPEKFSGEKCSLCEAEIYGDGFRLVLTVVNASDPLPQFKETDVKLCTACEGVTNGTLW